MWGVAVAANVATRRIRPSNGNQRGPARRGLLAAAVLAGVLSMAACSTTPPANAPGAGALWRRGRGAGGGREGGGGGRGELLGVAGDPARW